jgi:serine/threonine-protein kinase
VPEPTDVSSTKEVGVVVDQDPGASEMVANGSKVRLSVSAGPNTVELPDLKNFTQDEARARLATLGLKDGPFKQLDDPGLDKGKVASTSPAAGEEVPVDSAINLNVSSGKVTVPDVVGKTRNEAADTLGELGLSVKTTYIDSSESENTVLKQSIKAKTKVDDGSTITLTVAQPAPPTPTTTTATTTPPPPTDTPSTTTTTTPPTTTTKAK